MIREGLKFISSIIVGVAVLMFSLPKLRFAPVSEGILYRSAQPNKDQLKKLIKNYRIKTVINLRKPEECRNDPRCKDEREVTLKEGIKLINFPISAVPTLDELQRLVTILCDPQYYPILVHCELGRTRTGAAVAAYRIACEDYPVEVAFYEAKYFRYSKKNLEKLKSRLIQFQKLILKNTHT